MTQSPDPHGNDGGPFSLHKDGAPTPPTGSDDHPRAWSATPPGQEWRSATPPGQEWQSVDSQNQGFRAASYDPSQYGTPQYGQQPYPGQPYGPPQGQPYAAPQYPSQGYAPGYAVPGFAGVADPWAPFGRDPATGTPLSDKSKTNAGLLQLFLGGFGAGRFYLGHNGIAIAQLLTLIFGWIALFFIFGVFILLGLGVWTLVDAIMMFSGGVRDSRGLILRP